MQEIAKNDARERSCASWAELERSGHVERVTVVLKRNGKGSYGIDLNDYNVVTASTHTRPMTLTTIKPWDKVLSVSGEELGVFRLSEVKLPAKEMTLVLLRPRCEAAELQKQLEKIESLLHEPAPPPPPGPPPASPSPRFVPSRKNSVGTPTGPPIFSPAVKINVGKRLRETDENVENDANDANNAKLRAARLRLERRASSC